MQYSSLVILLIVIAVLISSWHPTFAQSEEGYMKSSNDSTSGLKKESAVLKPSVKQIVRSTKPYFSSLKKGTHQGRISYVEISKNIAFFVYLPLNHNTSENKFPVLYHLHGAGVKKKWLEHDIHWIATEHEKAIALGVSPPMIIVAPLDKSKFSMWVDSKDGENQMASMVTSEIRKYVEANFKAKRERSSRFIQGFSMGGFGAAMLGLKYQELYASIIILDGAMHDWRTINLGRTQIVENQFENDELYFNEWSPWEWVKRADLSKTPIFIIEGLMVDYNTRFFEYLKQHGAQVLKASPPCMHDVRCLEKSFGVQAFKFMHSPQLMSKSTH